MKHAPKWIFHPTLAGEDIYCDFYDTFPYTADKGRVTVRISADSNYALYINGRLADSGQYADYPHYKIYDELDVTPYLCEGENHLAVTVWHYGRATLCYFPGRPALLYEVECDGKCLLRSDAGVACRPSREYENGRARLITSQLGFGFHYDATGDDGWRLGRGEGFVPAALVDQELPLSPRPIKKLVWGEPVKTTLVRSDSAAHYLFDLGREEVGHLTLSLRSEKKQRLLITWGEHIIDGCVRRIIGPRDFSVEVTVGEGETVYTNPFRRFGLRYIEVFAEAPIKVDYLTAIPTDYPLTMRGTPPTDPVERRIYDVSVRTLALCMHEHYEDCPWREQALYCMDSRNQILCGYYCFNSEEFARASLRLMAEDRRDDGLLSITFPCGNFRTENGLVIPSFSLHYFTEIYEYTLATGDLTLAREVYPKLTSIADAFCARIKDGGVISFSGREYWNFFEWSTCLAGRFNTVEPERYEAALDLLLILALRSLGRIANLLGEENRYAHLIPALREGVRARYFDPASGLFYNREDRDYGKSELVNALAILADVPTEAEAAHIAALLAEGDKSMTEITISMLTFKYDALLAVDRARYGDVILADIRDRYLPMLEWGATSFWEYGYPTSIEGGKGSAASHCHGWSALPVYYYAILHGAESYSALH